MSTISPPCHRHLTDMSPTSHRYVTDISPIYHRHLTDTSPTSHRYITDTSPMGHRHLTDISPTLDFTNCNLSFFSATAAWVQERPEVGGGRQTEPIAPASGDRRRHGGVSPARSLRRLGRHLRRLVRRRLPGAASGRLVRQNEAHPRASSQ